MTLVHEYHQLHAAMRILQLTETLAAGGAETFIVRLANALAAEGHEVTIAVMNDIVHPALGSAIDPKVTVEHASIASRRWLLRAERLARLLRIDWRPYQWRQRKWLRALLQKIDPDAVHSHLLKADLLAATERKRSDRFRHIITIHGDYLMYLNGAADSLLYNLNDKVRQIVSSVDAIVGVAAGHLERFRKSFMVCDDRMHLIYNGYDAPDSDGPSRAELDLPEEKFLFGMVSRGIEQKGWKDAIDAFTALDRDDAALILVGEGKYLSSIQAKTKNPQVHFTGFAARPIDFVRHFDCGLLPSYYPAESLPTVVTEYLACGKPVVVTDVGEVASMLRTTDHRCAGQLVAARDVGALTKAMEKVISTPALRNEQSVMALDAFRKFSMATCLKRYEALYKGRTA